MFHQSTYYVASVGLMIVGLFTMLAKRNLIKVIIGLGLFETGINLLLVVVGYIRGATAPIFSQTTGAATEMVDPTPQALVLTAIVIGVAILALALSLAIRLHEHYGTLDLRKIRELKW